MRQERKSRDLEAHGEVGQAVELLDAVERAASQDRVDLLHRLVEALGILREVVKCKRERVGRGIES